MNEVHLERSREEIEEEMERLMCKTPETHVSRTERDRANMVATQRLILEVLLDIRDVLLRIESHEGVAKWGPKL